MDIDEKMHGNSRSNVASMFHSFIAGQSAVPPSIIPNQEDIFNTESQRENISIRPTEHVVIKRNNVLNLVYRNKQWMRVYEGTVETAIIQFNSPLHTTFELRVSTADKKPITAVRIDNKFNFKIQFATKVTSQLNANNVALFLDSKNVTRSLVFQTEEDQILFTNEIALARWITMDSEIIMQDLLILKDDDKIAYGDAVNIRYIAWPLQSSKKLKKESESKGTLAVSLTFEKQWQKALSGITNGGKRALIIPAQQLDEWEKTIGRKCPHGLYLQITVEKCSSIAKQQSVELALPSLPSLPSLGSRDDKGKDESKLRKNAKSKEELIERLGKLLPRGSKYDSDETEDDSSSLSSVSVKPKRDVHKAKHKSSTHVVGWPISGLQGDQFMTPAASVNSFSLMTAAVPAHQTQPLFSAHAQVNEFISDQRAHNAELRLAQTGATNKLDRLVEKTNSEIADKVIDKIKSIEQDMMGRMSTLIQSASVIPPNRGIPASVLEVSTDVCEDGKLLTMEELVTDNNRVRQLINEKCSVIDNLKSEIDMLTSCKQGLENELSAEKKKTEELQRERMATIRSLQEQVNSPHELKRQMESSMEEWTSEVLTLESALARLRAENERSTSTESESESCQVMEEMNCLYKQLKSEFNSNNEKIPAASVRKVFSTFFKDCLMIEEESGWSDDTLNAHSAIHG